jgi:hypothetical protein
MIKLLMKLSIGLFAGAPNFVQAADGNCAKDRQAHPPPANTIMLAPLKAIAHAVFTLSVLLKHPWQVRLNS